MEDGHKVQIFCCKVSTREVMYNMITIANMAVWDIEKRVNLIELPFQGEPFFCLFPLLFFTMSR